MTNKNQDAIPTVTNDIPDNSPTVPWHKFVEEK